LSLDQCFYHFKKWDGCNPEGYSINFLGAKQKNEYVTMEYPPFNEEYFEWVDLLESVLQAREEFVMFELGAGFGRWAVNGALAARVLGKDYRILAVEPEPQHFAWLKANTTENGLDPDKCELVEAAVSAREGEADFYVGNPAKWYGQALRRSQQPLSEEEKKDGVAFQHVKTVTLSKLLGRYDQVDLIDMDIQGSELEVLSESQEIFNHSVKRIHIGTHSKETEQGIRLLLGGLKWKQKWDFECLADRQTPYGTISFNDGVQG